MYKGERKRHVWSSSMYGSSSTVLGGLEAIGGMLIFVLIVAAVVNLVAISHFVRIAEEKKSDVSSGMLWFIGLFTPFVVLPLLVVAMPDHSKTQSPTAPSPTLPAREFGSADHDALPEI